MHKAIWFLLGFFLAGGLLIVLILSPIEFAAQPSAPSAQSDPTPTPDPLSTPETAGLHWRYRGIGGDDCRRMEIDDINQVRYGPCQEGLRLAYLTPKELTTYRSYLVRYTNFEYTTEEPQGPVDKITLHLQFSGNGRITPDIATQREIAHWADEVYDRLHEGERRSDLVAQARLDLARRLGTSIEEISILEVKETTWPDTCLGLRKEGHFCARVQTKGYRIALAECPDSGCHVYEYRADRKGLIGCREDYAPSMVMPAVSEDAS